MAYEENPISFPQRAPFEGLTRNIPRHTDATQLYSNLTPSTTLEGTTFLNGQVVDPLLTPNPMEFCILGTVMTEAANDEIFYTDTHWEGKIGELISYDRSLTNAEMKGASAYLRKKWISIADLESPRRVLEWDGIILEVETDLVTIPAVCISPNPTTTHFSVYGLEGAHIIQVLNTGGVVLHKFSAGLPAYDVHDLPAGMYFVRIKSAEQTLDIVTTLIKM